MTLNPSIFEKALDSSDYHDALRVIALRGTRDAIKAYEQLAIEDIQSAADTLHPVYDRTGGRDGFVSLEVSPLLAHDTQGTLEEARRSGSLPRKASTSTSPCCSRGPRMRRSPKPGSRVSRRG